MVKEYRVRTVTAEETTAGTQTQAIAASPRPAANDTFFQRVWPAAIVFFGAGLTVAWVALLGYGLTSIIGYLFLSS
jgi:hypothetical protein